MEEEQKGIGRGTKGEQKGSKRGAEGKRQGAERDPANSSLLNVV